jgi:hypothetical protein
MPVRPGMPGEELKEGAGAATLDDLVLLISSGLWE